MKIWFLRKIKDLAILVHAPKTVEKNLGFCYTMNMAESPGFLGCIKTRELKILAEKRQFLRIAKNLCATFVALFAFAITPARADGESISSVTVVGATEQSGTPTPTNPVNIVTNNGAIKVNTPTSGKNAINTSDMQNGYLMSTTGNAPHIQSSSLSMVIKSAIKVSAGKSYKFSYISNISGNREQNLVGSDGIVKVTYNFNCSTGFNEYTIIPQYDGELWLTVQSGDLVTVNPICYEIGSIYTEGAGETVRDSANHSANVETLFAVGDYADEQNINTGVITRKVGVKVLDGTETWTAYNVSGVGYSYRTYITGASTIKDDYKPVLSSHFEYTKWSWTQNKNSISFDNLENNLLYVRCLPFGQSSNVTGFKQWLAEQYAAGTPVIIVYPLATETTENVTAQTMTTAPVIQNNGTIATTIRTLLQNGQTLVSNSLELGIKIATTAYNAAAFAPVEAALETAVTTIKDVVANTIVQADAIQNLQDTKQTMPDASGTNGTCPRFRQCLLIETASGTPQWFPIIDPFKDFVTPILANNEHITSVATQRRYYGDLELCRMLPQTDAESQANNNIAKCTEVANWQNSAAANTVRGSALKQTEWGCEFKAANIGANPATDNPNNDEGIVYGISKCVSTEIPAGTYANPATSTQLNNALWDARPTTMAEASDYKNCWCKTTGIAYGGQYYETSAAPWVFNNAYDSAGDCATHCANFCANSVLYNAGFRSAALGWAME